MADGKERKETTEVSQKLKGPSGKEIDVQQAAGYILGKGEQALQIKIAPESRYEDDVELGEGNKQNFILTKTGERVQVHPESEEGASFHISIDSTGGKGTVIRLFNTADALEAYQKKLYHDFNEALAQENRGEKPKISSKAYLAMYEDTERALGELSELGTWYPGYENRLPQKGQVLFSPEGKPIRHPRDTKYGYESK